MYKRKIALILSLLMLFNILLPAIPIAYAETLSTETINDIQTLGAYQRDIFAKDLLLNSSISIDDIETYLTQYGEKYPLVSDNRKYRLNPYVYKKYKVVAYTNEEAYNARIAGLTNVGSPKKETQSLTLSDGGIKVESVDEYRYLGYKKNGIDIITNDFFPADHKSSVDMRDKNWVMNDPKVKSWDKHVLENPNALYYYLKTNVLNDENFFGLFEQTDYSIADLVHSNDYDTLTRYPKVMSDVSFSNPLVLNMIHRSGGTLWYDTMRLKQYAYDLDTKIDNVDVDVKVPVGTDSYDITYDVTTAITNVKTDGQSKDGKYFANVELNSNATEYQMFNNEDNKDWNLPTLKESNIIKTVDLKGVRPGESKTVTLNANSVVTTFDDGVRTDAADPVAVKITVVENDTLDFVIKQNETDITSANVTVNDLVFRTPFTCTLEDTSYVNSADVINRIWEVKIPTGWDRIDSGNKISLDYTIDTSNKDVVIDGKVNFRLIVVTEDKIVGNVEHYFLPVEKIVGPSGDVVAVLTSSANFNERKDYYEVMEGERFTLRGNKSYHMADLDIVDYDFDIGEIFGEGIKTGGSTKNIRAFYPNSDGGSVYKAYLTVTDEVGATDKDSIRTKVHPAEFQPEINIYGTFKENRKLSFFVDNTHKLTYYPIDESSLRWTITPLNGQGKAYEIDGSLNGSASFDGIINKKGSYKVHVEGYISSDYNTNRYFGEADQIITIAEDLKPIANFVVPKTEIRDVENGLMTRLYVKDLSYSPDDDIIAQRIWSYKFDSDNDGDFSDEKSVVFHAGNERKVYIEKDHVGKYQFELKVKEKFGQPTISKFIEDSDKKRDDTADKLKEEKITEITNVPPTVDLEVSQHKNVNLIIYEDLGTAEKTALESELTELKAKLLGKKLNLKTYYLSPTEIVGNRKVWTTYFDSYISVGIHVEGDDEDGDDIDYVQTYNFLLDSYTSEDKKSVADSKDPNRFKLVDVEWGDSHYEKFRYKNRRDDYKAFNYRELIVTYTENGVKKEKLYNFVFEYVKEDTYGNSDKYDKFDYDSYEIVNQSLHVDAPYVDRPNYVEENNTFSYHAEYRPKLNLPTKTSKDVIFKKYADSDLEGILKSCDNEDMFFLNLSHNEENRIALNKSLLEKLESKGITYLTLYDDLININPLSGRFDELVKGYAVPIGYNNAYNWVYYADELLVKLGNLGYRLDLLYGTYINMGDFEDAKEKMGVKDISMVIQPSNDSIYTIGYKYFEDHHPKTAYGLAAIDKKRQVEDDDEIDVWNAWKSFRKTSTDRTEFANSFPPSFFNNYCSNLNLMPDGKLVGTRLYLDRYNADFHKKAVYYGSNFIGTLNANYKYQTGSSRYTAKGFIHENGNIYFKQGNGKYDYNFENKAIITEGIDNIEYIECDEKDKSIYVYTNKMVVKYDLINGSRTVLAKNYIQRRKNAVEIEANVWLVKDQIFDHCKEVYYFSEGDSWVKLFIDENDNYYIERHFESNYPSINKTTKTLMGTDVNKLPLMTYLTSLSVGEANHNGQIRRVNGVDIYYSWHILVGEPITYKKYFMYVGNDGYLYSPKNLDQAFSLIDKDEIEGENVKARPMEYGKLEMIVPAGNYYREPYDPWRTEKFRTLESYSNGRVGINASYSDTSPTTTSKISYGNLTVGSAGEVVGDNQLISVTPLSASYASLSNLVEGILDIYKDYSTSESMTVLLGEVVDTAMIMLDYEDDPAYAMLINSEHLDPNYYENSLGRDPNVGDGIAMNQFNYVGVYKLIPRVRDNPVGDDDRFDNYRLWNKDDTSVDVYVHRKPIANMHVYLKEEDGDYSISLKDNGSYDLDHESLANKGIVAWEWSVKGDDASLWERYHTQDVTLDDLKEEAYSICLRVRDQEGVWSDPVKEHVDLNAIKLTLSASLKAETAQFSLSAMPITEYLKLYNIETVYPKAVTLEYGLYQNDNLVATITSQEQEAGVNGTYLDAEAGIYTWQDQRLQIGEKLADGLYQLKITAYDTGNRSIRDDCSFDVTVRTPIHPEPIIEDLFIAGETQEIRCRTSIYTDEVMLNLYDASSHEVNEAMSFDQYIYDNVNGVEVAVKKEWTLDHDVPSDITEGVYDMVFTGAVDTTPNKKEAVTAPVHLITLAFESVEITGAWNHWRGQVDLLGEQLEDMPYRFLSWEKIYFTAQTRGNPDVVSVDMSEVLKAMSFTDGNGVTYDYKDDFGAEVEFPMKLTKKGDNLWTGEYILPLAPSTIDWENKRQTEPYEIVISAIKNDVTRHYKFNAAEGRGIDITGNTTDLIYVQPMKDR